MRVYNVPASAPFLRTVIAALLDGGLIDGFSARNHPERLADATIYLPTRRATRLARNVFLDVLGQDAAILPRLVPLGDIDEDELIFAQPTADNAAAAIDLPPAIEGLERRLTLAGLIAAWAARLRPDDRSVSPLVVGGPAPALALADDLARLMDDMLTRKVAWTALDRLVPEKYDRYWQLTLQFLTIPREFWPQRLSEIGRMEAAERRDVLIEAETRRLAQTGGPVIAAGSTGSMPATAALLHAIAALPQGAVVLPGLDWHLDDDAWASIARIEDGDRVNAAAQNHPQFALHALLDRLGLKREDVRQLAEPAAHGREWLLSEAMRPAESTALWQSRLAEPAIDKSITDGMRNVAMIEAPNSELEALAIAVSLREAHETKKTAALVTPDRALARRVLAQLARWNLVCNDSGGDRLTETPAGLFARLVANAVHEQLAPAALLALLKHPLLRLGRQRAPLLACVADLELALLRGTRPPPGLDGLRHSLATFRAELEKFRRHEFSSLHRSEPRTSLSDEQIDAVSALIDDLARALAPLVEIGASATHDFSTLAARHCEAIERLTADEDGTPVAFTGSDGQSLFEAFQETQQSGAQGLLGLRLGDYAEAFETAFSTRVVRRAEIAGATLSIYGQLEARLTWCDRVILGGLTEGVWPPEPGSDPWLSRPMRQQIGLDLPERRIGLSAHDFAQLMGMPEVVLTRATKVGGAPAVASRFLHRLEAVAGRERWAAARQAGATLLAYAEALDRPLGVQPIAQPAPKPPRAARPTALSVTEIEHWLRDPYTIYAKHILKLAPLDPVDMPLSAADRGSAIHAAVGEFTQAFARELPGDAREKLLGFGRKHFAPLLERPEARALWWPRFLRIADWLVAWERSRRDGIAAIHAEASGRIEIPLDHGRSFRLTARADRIERRTDGNYTLLDYKTGSPPTGRQVRIGLSPQLTLEAAMLREGGFADIRAGCSIAELIYVKLSGNTPAGEPQTLDLKRSAGEPSQSPDEAAIEALQKLEALVRRFEDENQPYHALVLPMWRTRYGDYDDLARIKEWSATQGTVEDVS
jgi:ATP-dependent helicase/nuclease subunit B